VLLIAIAGGEGKLDKEEDVATNVADQRSARRLPARGPEMELKMVND
jgi:hypothetical protein